MKPIVPLVAVSALLALGAGAWFASRTPIVSTEPPNLETETPVVRENENSYLTVTETSDFTPPLGRPENPPPASAGERRLLTATSTDGVHFAATGSILTDQGNVPDIVMDADGTIRMYYIGQSIEEGSGENTVVALSRDNGTTWEFKKLTFVNLPQPREPSDPDVVLLEDGTYRMYYTSSIPGDVIGIVYADSPDGITFTYGGLALQNTVGSVIDSSTVFFNDLWHMTVLQGKVNGQLYATSTDGLTFTLAEDSALTLPGNQYITSNALIEDDTLRMFAFSLAEKNIRSFTTNDFLTWTTNDVALDGDSTTTLGSNYIQDSSVGMLADGTYLMVYVSEIPEE
jgi:hypothetical protein